MSALASFLWQDKCVCYLCRIEFASPLISVRRNDGHTFYCPNGHAQSFGETEVSRLREEAERLKNVIASRDRDLEWQLSQRQTAEKRLVAQKGLTTRAKNKLKRVHCGVCPECNRSFGNLREHMKTKHGGIA